MKQIYISILFLLSLILQSSAGIAGEYSIAIFKTTDRNLTFKNTNVIKGENGKVLQEIDSIGKLKPGYVVVRKKFDPSDYRFYLGLIDSSSFNREPPLFAFQIPKKIQKKVFLHSRFYSEIPKNHSTDIDEIYFDDQNFYVNHYSRIYYFYKNEWKFVDGKRKFPSGTIAVSSEPAGAQIIINGISLLKKTPCTLENLACGKYTIELFLPHYHFSHKEFTLTADTTVTLSFQLLSDMDTVYITGNNPEGILLLPQPPIDSGFILDTLQTPETRLRLLPGTYSLKWNGGDVYRSIDTTIQIIEGRITYFNYIFQRRTGMIRVTTVPLDAEICIDSLPCALGERVFELPTGNYHVVSQRQGFIPARTDIYVVPDTVTQVNIDLQMNSDRDGDGYLDTLDKCPDVYGIYDGCPKRRLHDAIQVKKDDIKKFVKEDHFKIGFSLIGIISKIPTRRYFAHFLSSFSSERVGGINNYRGLSFLNSMHLLYKGIYGSFEMGQWSGGLSYKRADTLHIENGEKEYLIFYDTILGVEPKVLLPSTNVSLGVHYNWSWVNVIYAIGYQWEDIIIDEIFDPEDESLKQVVFDNDWWYHQLQMDIDFHADKMFIPSFYFKFKFPFGPVKRTRWSVIQAGIQLKISPFPEKGYKYYD